MMFNPEQPSIQPELTPSPETEKSLLEKIRERADTYFNGRMERAVKAKNLGGMTATEFVGEEREYQKAIAEGRYFESVRITHQNKEGRVTEKIEPTPIQALLSDLEVTEQFKKQAEQRGDPETMLFFGSQVRILKEIIDLMMEDSRYKDYVRSLVQKEKGPLGNT